MSLYQVLSSIATLFSYFLNNFSFVHFIIILSFIWHLTSISFGKRGILEFIVAVARKAWLFIHEFISLLGTQHLETSSGFNPLAMNPLAKSSGTPVVDPTGHEWNLLQAFQNHLDSWEMW